MGPSSNKHTKGGRGVVASKAETLVHLDVQKTRWERWEERRELETQVLKKELLRRRNGIPVDVRVVLHEVVDIMKAKATEGAKVNAWVASKGIDDWHGSSSLET